MAYEAILEEVKDLPEDSQTEVLHFILFLKSKKENEEPKMPSPKKPKRKFDIMAGKLLYMADDFDETPECFEEYM